MIGWIGWAFCFYAGYLLGERKIFGFYVGLVGEACLLADAIAYRHLSLGVAAVAWAGLHVVNIRKWRRRA